MAIQMRRGAYDDFDPSKMRAGEWAVSTDSETSKQQVWMCFAPGIVKRIGTFEDFDVEIRILFQSYMDDISNSVNTARGYADTATTQASNAAASATNAKASETNAANSRKTAQSYAVGGTQSRAGEDTDNAKYYSQQASASKTAAAASATNAKASENQALSYKNSASASEQASKTSETNAKTSAGDASSSATSASASASEANKSKTSASASASQAKTSETNAKTSETNSAKSESEAQKYAEQAKEISESLSGALRPLGTISFANLPSTAGANSGDMYNITDQFTTTADFKEGSGNIIPAGSNVYLTIDRYWDVLAGTPVTGVKGSSESIYRRGNVNITKANVGLGNVGNFKAVSTVASQGLSDTEKANARNNIGAGTSSFSGNYNDLSNRPISKYNASVNYSYGNIVDYNNKFYRMIMKPASGTTGMIKNIIPTNTTYWKEITITDLAKEMSNAVNIMTSLTASTFDFSNIGVTGGTKYTVEESLSQIATALSTLNGNLNSKSNTGHTHDERYYTESEVNNLLNNKANANHNHDSLYSRAWSKYEDSAATKDYDSNHTYYDFTAPYTGRYLFIVNFRPIAFASSCRLKIGSTSADPAGGVSNVPQYAFDSFPVSDSFSANETKRLFFEMEKGCTPTIRMHIIKVS